jgi:hypothetical protein
VVGPARRAAALAITLAVSVGLAVGCSQREGSTPSLAPIETTTTAPESGVLSPTTSEPGPSKAQGQSLSEIVDDFDQAVAGRDFCGLLSAMNSDLPDTDDHAAVTETYRKVADSVRAARSFVPSQLSDQWAAVVDATESAAKAASRAQGQIGDPALQASFSTAAFQAATVDLDAWNDGHCSPT